MPRPALAHALRFAVVVLLAVVAAACDTPPDIHVHVTGEGSPPAEYAVWRTLGRYRLKPRMVHRADYREEQRDGGLPVHVEVPAEVRVTPLGALPAHEWVTLRVDRYEPGYTRNRPVASAVVLTRFVPARHLRLDVHLLRPGQASGWGGASGGAGCDFALAAPGCHPATDRDLQNVALPDPLPGPGDIDDDDDWIGPEGFGASPATCVFVCPTLPGNDAPAPTWPPFRESMTDADADAGADAAETDAASAVLDAGGDESGESAGEDASVRDARDGEAGMPP